MTAPKFKIGDVAVHTAHFSFGGLSCEILRTTIARETRTQWIRGRAT